jgi:acyl-ACP thioesterase
MLFFFLREISKILCDIISIFIYYVYKTLKKRKIFKMRIKYKKTVKNGKKLKHKSHLEISYDDVKIR